LLFTAPYALSSGASISNSVIFMGINQQPNPQNPQGHGGAIDSLKVLGVETIDVQDLGRLLQASLSIGKPTYHLNNRPTCLSGQLAPQWFNPQEGGDFCRNASVIKATSTFPAQREMNVITAVQSWQGEDLWDENDLNSHFLPDFFTIEGHHKLGPLPYANYEEAIRLQYIIRLESGAPTPSIVFLNDINDANGNPTPTSWIPAIYFKDNVLTRAFGLSMNGSNWTEINVPIGNFGYLPKLVKYRSVAWMRSDLSWGVALYGRNTLNQTHNFALEKKPVAGTNLVNLIYQNLGTLQRGQEKHVRSHMAVGNLNTLKLVINQIYNSGN